MPQEHPIREFIERLENNHALVELPFSTHFVDQRELSTYIKNELNDLQFNLSEFSTQNFVKTVHQNIENYPQIFYLLRLILQKTYLLNKKNLNDWTQLNLEDILNVYIGNEEIFL